MSYGKQAGLLVGCINKRGMLRNMNTKYQAMVSTDWNECLSPMGPFDPIIFAYPEIKSELAEIFRSYTSNKITLAHAVERLQELMPAPLTMEQMDKYLDHHFSTYRGVPEFIRWCNENNVFFMINTTASIGFFQRVLNRGLLPGLPALSAHPGIRFPPLQKDPGEIYELMEITDKSLNTDLAASLHGIPYKRIIIIGDSGGDGPHFEWGARKGAFLIGSMTKKSLDNFCSQKGITIDLYLGPRYEKGEKRDEAREMAVDFMDLTQIVKKVLAQ